MSYAQDGRVETDEPQADTQNDAAVIAECADRLRQAIHSDRGNRAAALDDLEFLKGEQWDPVIQAQRQRDQRPCLTLNKLPVFLRQVTNAQRQNVPSIKVHPVGESDAKVAEVVQGAIRHIEYSSGADIAYDTAVGSAAAIGFGYFRLITDYEREDSFDQCIKFQRIRNPFTVYTGPHSMPDGSDMQWCIVTEKLSRAEFRAQYPEADACDFNGVTGLGDKASDWVTSDEVRVAEYYRIFKAPAKVVMLSDGRTGFADEIDMQGATVRLERQGVRSTVQWFKLTANEVIDRADIPSRWIPVFPVYGDEIDVNGEVYRSGLIRHAKDPARMYNFWMTAATEEVALRPKSPFIGAEGQFEGHEDEWELSNRVSFPYLEYKPKTIGGQLAPPPQRQPMADLPSGVLAMAMHANDDIKATTGIFDASLGARSNETSGIAIARRDRQGEVANFHYSDNLASTLRHCGRVILDMWPKVYDGTRTLQIMSADGKVSSVPINAPEVDPVTGAVRRVLNDMSVGQYAVTISVGPSFDTLRQEAVDGMVQVGQAWPKLWEVAGDKLVRTMDWPMADEIADRLKRAMPPELAKDDDEAAEQQAIPPEVEAQLQQYEQALQDAMRQLDEARSGVDKAKISAEAQIRVAEINATSRQDIEELKGWVQLLLQKLQPPPSLTAEVGESVAKTAPAQPAEQPVQADATAMLAQIVKALNPPRRKTMAIQAPSGMVYQGEIVDRPEVGESDAADAPPQG